MVLVIMKKTLKMLISGLVLLSFIGCKGENPANTDTPQTPQTTEDNVQKVVICGSSKVVVVDAKKAIEDGVYTDAVIWEWDCRSSASVTGIAASKTHNVDECKVVEVNGKNKILVTCSNNKGWCMMVDMKTSTVDFYALQVTNAHSAEYVEGKILAAMGTGINIYDSYKDNSLLNTSTLSNCHGVVWHKEAGKLYCIGGDDWQTLNSYTLEDWNGDKPNIKLESTWSIPVSGVHDLTYVDEKTLCVSGVNSYLFDITNGTFTEMKLLNGRTAIKSVNYNAKTGEVWYTDSTVPEGGQTWSTQTICYSVNKDSSAPTATFKVPDMNVYKVRVLNW